MQSTAASQAGGRPAEGKAGGRWGIHTPSHIQIRTVLSQAGGISLLLMMIMKWLHVEHTALHAQHD